MYLNIHPGHYMGICEQGRRRVSASQCVLADQPNQTVGWMFGWRALLWLALLWRCGMRFPRKFCTECSKQPPIRRPPPPLLTCIVCGPLGKGDYNFATATSRRSGASPISP